MSLPQTDSASGIERRKFPRYFVDSGLTLAIEDATLRESIGIGEPDDISVGGLRVRNLPACPNVRVGDRLAMLLIDREDALSLTGEVVHHATSDTFGVEFSELSTHERVAVGGVIDRLHGFTDL
jgi:hypothetical protein